MKFLYLFFFVSTGVLGQLIQIPLEHRSKSDFFQKRKLQSLPMNLPFWDDFSFTENGSFANDTLWESGNSAMISTGLSIDPPSIYSATFDGIDSLGKPYNLTDILAKGSADKMVSRKIRLDLVPQSKRNTVYLSFYYQIQGRGEAPDQDDNLSLWFLDKNGAWEKIFETGRAQNPDPTKFSYVILPVAEERFFHDKFQFRFQNFSRLSGPYDMWHLDYVYLNKDRVAGEKSMPDRTISSNLSRPFSGYYSIPLHHFKDAPAGISDKLNIRLFGLLENNFQPFRYSTTVKAEEISGTTTTSKAILVEQDAAPINSQTGGAEIIEPFKILNLTLQKSFPIDQINLQADSINIEFKFVLKSEDDNPLVYLPKYQPINFLRNDTIRQRFSLAKYYSRDDGEAEFGAGLNQPGTELGYGFDLLHPTPDTVVAVDIYFPQFGDQSNQTLTLKLWNGGETGPISQLHQQTIQVRRTTENRFVKYELTEPVIVFRKFFIGWKQTSAAIIPVGFDKNTDSGDQIYFNVTGDWEQNTQIYGSLMIRPVFGSGKGVVINKLDRIEHNSIFPNPSAGIFSINESADSISVVDLLGRTVNFEKMQFEKYTVINISQPSDGIYLIRWTNQGMLKSARALIKKY